MLTLVLAFFLGCVLLSPVLLLKIGAPLAKDQGIRWQEDAYDGFASIRLLDVEVVRPGLVVRIDTLTLPQPGPLLLGRAGLREPPLLEAGQVEFVLKKGSESPATDPTGPEILETIRSAVLEIQPWLPDVAVESLEFAGDDDSLLFALDQIRFTGRALSAVLRPFRQLPSTKLSIWLTDASIRLAGTTGEGEAALRLVMATEETSTGIGLSGKFYSRDQNLEVDAGFEPGHWLPSVASLEAEDWPVPLFLLPGEHQLEASPEVGVTARFSGTSFQADLNLRASEAGPGNESAAADIRLSGNTEAINLDRVSVRTDWIQADLSQPIRYNLQEKAFSGEAQFAARLFLDRQAYVPASGLLEAEVYIKPETDASPEMEFRMTGENLTLSGQAMESLLLTGSLDYPQVSIGVFEAGISGGSRLRGSGSLHLEDQVIDLELAFELAAELLGSVAPNAGLTEALSGQLNLNGPWKSPRHSGRFAPVALAPEGLQPMLLSLDWTGRGTSSIDLRADVEASPGGTLRMAAEIVSGSSPGDYRIRFTEVAMRQGSGPVLGLQKPMEIRIDTRADFPMQSVSDFQMRGEAGRLSGQFDYTDQELLLEISEFDTGFLSGWVERTFPAVFVDSADLSFDQLTPFFGGTFAVSARSPSEPLESLKFNLSGTLGRSGIQLQSVEGLLGEASFVSGSLELPIRLPWPGARTEQRALIDTSGRLNGNFTADISGKLASQFPEIPYVERFAGSRIDLSVEGTMEEPSGNLNARLAAIPGGLLHPMLEEYQLEGLVINAILNAETIQLETLEARLQEARIVASGSLETKPLATLIGKSGPDWRNAFANARLDVVLDGFNAEAFASLLPPYLRPTGHLAADLRIHPGPSLDGEVRMEDFSLRPTLYTQTIDDIDLFLKLDGTRLELETATASVGDGNVRGDGYVDFEDPRALVYHVEFHGSRTPLVRTPDLLLHADVDLVLDRLDAALPAILEGSLEMRDSVLLMDIDPLAARMAGQAMAKPPFFRVPAEPFSDWELDIRISGEDAIRLRSQYAKALFSVNMSLDGTLGTPVLVGEIFTTEGQIQFPGTRLSLARSEVFVTRERQQTLQLDLNAIGRVASTIISAGVSGSVEEPYVELSSTPGLSTTQIIQLLATGSLEGGGAGSIGLYLGKGLFGPGSADGGFLDRLSVEFGRDVSESGESTVDLYFDLTERLRLHGEYDKYDDQNLNLEWEVFSR